MPSAEYKRRFLYPYTTLFRSSALRTIRELFDAECGIQEAFHRPMKLTAETLIKSDRETVWRLSQTPLLHARWDLRFTDIEYLPRESAAEPQRFRYATRIGFGLAVKGWGETIGDPERSTSALR